MSAPTGGAESGDKGTAKAAEGEPDISDDSDAAAAAAARRIRARVMLRYLSLRSTAVRFQ